MSAEPFHSLIRAKFDRSPGAIRLLDFGCGAGGFVKDMLALGYDAYGCDIGADWPDDDGVWKRGKPGAEWSGDVRERLAPITNSPYRLPYPDGTFDLVVSNSVLEHASNKEEAFAEMVRVLKPDGMGIHLIPAKWVFIEPHIFVPFVSWMWPNVPDWWLKLWAFLGVRNGFNTGLTWRQVADRNRDYCRTGIHYWRLRQYRALFRDLSLDYIDLDPLRLEQGHGRIAALARTLGIVPIVSPIRAIFQEACVGIRRASRQ